MTDQTPTTAIATVPIDDLIRHPETPRRGDIPAISASIEVNGWYGAVVAQSSTRHVLAGNHRMEAARRLGMTDLPVHWLDVDDATARRILLADNRTSDLATYDDEVLVQLLEAAAADDDLIGTGYDSDDLDDLLADTSDGMSLESRFGAPPFSVLDSRQGYWQDRKREWLSLGMMSELGRGEVTDDAAFAGGASRRDADRRSNLTGAPAAPAGWGSGMEYAAPGTSIFDPVLCELMVRWFSPEGGAVLDPFAGGVVRGAVASRLGRSYVGIDLSAAQIAANEGQRHLWETSAGPPPRWVTGDARNLSTLIDDDFDMLLACPPYADLEQYSDDPDDLSNLDPDDFLDVHGDILATAVDHLKDNRFAVWIVSEVRHSRRRGGPCLGLVAATMRAMTDAGLHLYNEAVLVNQIGTLQMRAARAMNAGRKLGRTHQNIIVGYKGDPSEIGEHFASLDLLDEVTW